MKTLVAGQADLYCSTDVNDVLEAYISSTASRKYCQVQMIFINKN